MWGVAVVGDNCGNMRCACPDVAHSSVVASIVSGLPLGEDVNLVFREELGGSNVTSTPVRTFRPIYSESRRVVLDERIVPPF